MIDIEQMDIQIRTAMRLAGRGHWHFTLEAASSQGRREEKLKSFPAHVLGNLMQLDSTLKKLVPDDFHYELKFDERSATLEIGYLDGWVLLHRLLVVIRTTEQLSSIEDLRLHIGDLVVGAKTEDEPPPRVVQNSAQLFIFLTSLDWEKLRTESLIDSGDLQKNSPFFKGLAEGKRNQVKDDVIIHSFGPKEQRRP